ncbi:dihydrolipoamide acetyltransferase family protein [Sphingobacterium spiritivorum]
MALYNLTLPKMGESVSEATVTKWLKEPGDRISEDEAVVEVATDKVDSDVPSPVSGILKEKKISGGEIAQVGQIIAVIEIEGEGEETTVTSAEVNEAEANMINPTPVKDEDIIVQEIQLPDLEIPGVDQLPASPAAHKETVHNSIRFYSPLVRNIAQEEGLSQQELDSIPGTASDGRVTKQDVLNYLQQRKQSGPSNATPAQTGTAAPATTAPAPSATKAIGVTAAGDEIIEMDRMRRLIADHMVKSVQTSPHVCSFVEADVTNMVNWRNKIKDSYKKREGENITFTPLFIEAISKALKDFPMVNVSIDGTNIIKRKNINIGMAAALPTGNLIVPVIKNADQLSLVGLSKSVNDLAVRSRANKLKPDDTQGGTFTFTNIGAFGNIMGTPIINQPQAAILAVGTITKKPAVIETEFGDMIGIRHIMYLSMSYDHRVIDGALGGTFLKRVADYLEQWDTNRVI